LAPQFFGAGYATAHLVSQVGYGPGFVLREAVSQRKLCCCSEVKVFPPKKKFRHLCTGFMPSCCPLSSTNQILFQGSSDFHNYYRRHAGNQTYFFLQSTAWQKYLTNEHWYGEKFIL